MPLRNLLIWGTGGHARVIAEAVAVAGNLRVTGYVNDVGDLEEYGGVNVLRSVAELESRIRETNESLIIGFGECSHRRQLIARLNPFPIQFEAVIHPGAHVLTGAEIGAGSFVAVAAVVGVEAHLAKHCIVNTGASIDHDCVLDANVHLAPGARLAGSVRVGHSTFIGMGATVCPKVTIGACSIIGAGAVVLANVPDGVIVAGVPARILRELPM